MYWCFKWSFGIWGVRFPGLPYFSLRAPWWVESYSERSRHVLLRMPLGFGWRVVVR